MKYRTKTEITKLFQHTKHVTDFKVYAIRFVLYILHWKAVFEGRCSVMGSTSALHAKVCVIHFVLYILHCKTVFERRGSVMVSTTAKCQSYTMTRHSTPL